MNTTFNFQENNVLTMDLETLKRTHKENNIYGEPLKGFYHYEVIDRLADLCELKGLDFEIKDIFAAQNRSRQMPGVVVLPQVEAIHGINAVEAHILRRVYSNIVIHNGENDEITTNLAIAYHQDGVQIGFGPLVKVCTNQCIMNPERLVSNFGNNKVTDDELFKSVESWLDNFFDYQEKDLRILQKMNEITLKENDVFQLVGLLTSLRVAKDCTDKRISNRVKNYPLTQSQISQFTEDYLLQQLEKSIFTLLDIYNIATNLYKPDKMEIPNVLPQNLAMMEVLTDRFNL